MKTNKETVITVIVDNNAKEPYFGEHGLAILVEHDEKKILLDTGQGNALFHNAEQLDISLSNLDALVLSHGHYDHGGNLAEIFSLNPSIEFFAHPDINIKRYSSKYMKQPKYIGLSSENIEAVNMIGSEHDHRSNKTVNIVPGVFFTGEVPRKNSFENTGGHFFTDKKGLVPDLIRDDISIWIEVENFLILICGCCHSGLINTIEHVQSFYDSTRKIDTIIGGFHLIKADRNRLEETVNFINASEINRIYPAHCTGTNAINLFKEKLDVQTITARVGLKVKLKDNSYNKSVKGEYRKDDFH